MQHKDILDVMQVVNSLFKALFSDIYQCQSSFKLIFQLCVYEKKNDGNGFVLGLQTSNWLINHRLGCHDQGGTIFFFLNTASQPDARRVSACFDTQLKHVLASKVSENPQNIVALKNRGGKKKSPLGRKVKNVKKALSEGVHRSTESSG